MDRYIEDNKNRFLGSKYKMCFPVASNIQMKSQSQVENLKV